MIGFESGSGALVWKSSMAESGYKNTVAIKQQGNEIKRRSGKDVNSYSSALGKIQGDE